MRRTEAAYAVMLRNDTTIRLQDDVTDHRRPEGQRRWWGRKQTRDETRKFGTDFRHRWWREREHEHVGRADI